MPVYFDNAATTFLDPQVREFLVAACQQDFANPSSIHSLGRKANKLLQKARKEFADFIGAEKEEVIFTSGATEANNFVFKSLNYDLIITSPTEHACVLEAAKASGKPIIWLNPNQDGSFNYAEIEEAIKKNPSSKILLSLMHVNNETGSVTDLEAIGEIKNKFSNVIFHSDCVQSLTKTELDVKKFNLDAASFSAHKIHGPKGVGALYLSPGLKTSCRLPLISGGGQEFGLRSGTENIVYILAFAESLKASQHKLFELDQYFRQKFSVLQSLVFNGSSVNKIPGIFNLSLVSSSLKSEELVLQLDLKGFIVSSGSACSSNNNSAKITSSYVLRACKIPENLAARAIRVSLSRFNTQEEIDNLFKIISQILEK